MKQLKLTFLITLFLTSTAWAAQADGHKPNTWLSEKKFQQMKAGIKKKIKRKIANRSEITDDLMSKEYRLFRTQLLNITKKHQIDKLIDKLNKNYDSYPTDLQFVAAQLIPLQAFRSFGYKMYPLVKKKKVTHTVILSQVFNMASAMKINLPTQQWDAGFRYVFEPLVADEGQFQTSEELQYFMHTNVYPHLARAVKRLESLNLNDKKIVWDNKLLYGSAAFTDDLNRFQYIGEAERLGLLANLHTSMSWVRVFNAYNVKGAMDLLQSMGALYGIAALPFSKVEGVTALRAVNVLKQKKFEKLFTLKKFGKTSLEVAFQHLREAVYYQVLAYNEIRSRPENELDIINSVVFNGFERQSSRAIEALERLVAGPTKVRSDITGEMVLVDLPAFFRSPPADLKDLAPNRFHSQKKTVTEKLATSKGKKQVVEFRNFFYGQPLGWDTKAYKNLFPELKSPDSVSKANRILNQSVGGGPITGMLNMFMIYNN